MWHDETRQIVPAGAVEEQKGDGTDPDALANFCNQDLRFGQMFVHGLDADCRHDEGGAGAARRAVFDKLRRHRTGRPR